MGFDPTSKNTTNFVAYCVTPRAKAGEHSSTWGGEEREGGGRRGEEEKGGKKRGKKEKREKKGERKRRKGFLWPRPTSPMFFKC